MQSDPRIKTSLQGDDGYIISHKFPLARCFFQKIPASVQIFHALSPHHPDCLHWPLIFQEVLMDTQTWYKASFGASDLGESIPFQDEWRWRKWRTFWECCSFELWMIQGGTRRKLPSRQGDDGYIIDIISHKYPLPGVEDSSKRSLPLFKYSMPFHLAIQILCSDHWSARNCRLDALLNEPCEICEGIYLRLLCFPSNGTRSASKSLIATAATYIWDEATSAPTTHPQRTAPIGMAKHNQLNDLGVQKVIVPRLSFPYAILLWSSTEQWNCKLVPRKSEHHRSSSIKKRKQMSRCRFSSCTLWLKQFQQTLAMSLVPFCQSLPGAWQSFAPQALIRTRFQMVQLLCLRYEGRNFLTQGFMLHGRSKIDSLLPTLWEEI